MYIFSPLHVQVLHCSVLYGCMGVGKGGWVFTVFYVLHILDHFSVDILLNPSKHSLVLLAHPLLSHPCTVARDSSAEQKKGNAVSFQLINVPREDVLRTS